MIIICHGMVKSANSFATQITLDLIKRHCQESGGRLGDLREFEPETDGIYLHMTKRIDDFLSKMQDKQGDCGEFFVIKWHGMPTPFVAQLIGEEKVAAISTFRNPMDVSLSLMDVSKREEAAGKQRFKRYKSIEDTIEDIDYQIHCHLRWAQIKQVEKIHFDDLAHQPHLVAKRISSLLGVKYNGQVVDEMIANRAKIWEFNKGIADRYKIEMSANDLHKYSDYWKEFLRYIESSAPSRTASAPS